MTIPNNHLVVLLTAIVAHIRGSIDSSSHPIVFKCTVATVGMVTMSERIHIPSLICGGWLQVKSELQ